MHKFVLCKQIVGNIATKHLHCTRGAEKSLAQTGWIQITFSVFYGTWRFVTTFKRGHHLTLT